MIFAVISRSRTTLAAIAVSGCGRIYFDPSGIDASSPCVLGPFGPVQALTELNSTYDEQDAELSSDGLEVFFRSTRPPGAGATPDLWRAVRTSTDEPFGPPALIPELQTAEWEGDAALTDDGLQLWFTRGPFPVDIYHTTRSARDQPFGPATPETINDISNSDASPWVNGDGTEIYFSSVRAPTAGSFDVWHATRATPDVPFGPPTRVVELAAADEQCCVALSPDGQEMLFASVSLDPPRTFAIGHARWLGSMWGEVEVFAPTASMSDEPDVNWSRDGRTVIFSSTRPGGMGQADLYMIQRACE